ncbi:MAG TPA: DNA repair protein RecO [Dyella sp.]|nr:DNA repair protein RecO [Dyella sp.]
MLIEQQPAYVLHTRPYRETSLLIECLTRDHGRLGVVARGVRSQRGRTQRSQLEPFQALALDLQMRGELATLRNAESTASPLRLPGDAGLAGLYVNELVVRLTERQDPHPTLYLAYAKTLERLAGAQSLAWHLRRFERDLLAALGYALQLDIDADSGEPLQADALYVYRPEHGAVRCRANEPYAVRGDDLSALLEDRRPNAQGLHALRGMMRELIRFHLGGVELRAWRVLRGALARR